MKVEKTRLQARQPSLSFSSIILISCFLLGSKVETELDYNIRKQTIQQRIMISQIEIMVKFISWILVNVTMSYLNSPTSNEFC